MRAEAVLRRPRARPGVWRHLLKALTALGEGYGGVLRHDERGWASATFAGSRHRVVLVFTGLPAVAAGEHLAELLGEHEFSLPGHIVADAAVVAISHTLLPEVRLVLELELLVLEDW